MEVLNDIGRQSSLGEYIVDMFDDGRSLRGWFEDDRVASE